MQNLHIRNIADSDHYEIEWLTKRAFWNVNMPGCDEHYFVHRLWCDTAYLPELSFTAELNGKVVGAILYAAATVATADGDVHTLSFGPLCVDPELQRSGIGAALLKKSMERAKELGYSSIFICGVPAYYPKFGFVTADKLGITMPDGSNFDAFMGIELTAGSLSGISGKYYEPAVYEGDIHDPEYMKKVDEFDKQFPYMEKLVLPTQWR